MINIILLHISKRKKVVSFIFTIFDFKKLRGNRYLKKNLRIIKQNMPSVHFTEKIIHSRPLTDITIFIFTKKQINSFSFEICNRKYLPRRFNATVRAMRHDIKCDNIWSNSFFYSYRTVYKQQGVFYRILEEKKFQILRTFGKEGYF